MSEARRSQPGKLRRALSGDLDNIVLMAMRKEPERRYATAEGLSEDIARHLEGMPVAARKDTLRYRAAKLASPRQGAAPAIAAALAGAALSAAFVTWLRSPGRSGASS